MDGLVEGREGQSERGGWVTSDQVWRDDEGCWHSKWHLARVSGRPDSIIRYLLRVRPGPDGVTRFKLVPTLGRPEGGGKGRGWVAVYHETEPLVRELLGLGGSRGNNDHSSGPGAIAHGSTVSPKKRGRGRPKGKRDAEVVERRARMLAAWDRGERGDNKAATGRAYGFDRSDATKLINRHEREKAGQSQRE